MDIMRLGFGGSPGLWKIFEICNLETMAWSMWRCSSTCDKFGVTLDGIVWIRPWLLMKFMKILNETMLYGQWIIMTLEIQFKRDMITSHWRWVRHVAPMNNNLEGLSCNSYSELNGSNLSPSSLLVCVITEAWGWNGFHSILVHFVP